MKRIFAAIVGLCLIASGASAYWQSRSQVAVTGGAPPTFQGAGDIVGSAKAYYGLYAYTAALRGNAVANVCNSTGGTDAGCQDMLSDATTGLIVPATVSGITCPGANCTVKILYDQTAGNNCSSASSCNLVQNTISLRPNLIASSVLGSNPCIQFTGGVNQKLPSGNGIVSAGTSPVSQPYSISVVGERTGVFTTQAGFIYFNGNGGDIEVGASTNTWVQYSGTSQSFTASDSNPHAVQSIYNGASSNVYVDGSSTSTNPNTSSTGGAGSPIIMGDNGGGHAFTGCVGEVGFWASAFSGGQQSSMNTNQHTNWGF